MKVGAIMEFLGLLIGLLFGVGVWILATAIAGSTKRREQAWRNMVNCDDGRVSLIVENQILSAEVRKTAKEAQEKIDKYRLDQEEKFRQQARERREEINLIMLANLMRVADHENSRYAIGRAS